MKHRLAILAVCVSTMLGLPAAAQPATTIDPVALKAARDVVGKMQGDRTAVLQSMSTPLAGLIAQMGVSQPDRAQVLVSEVIVPTLSAHLDDLIEIQARAYASILSVSDLQAAAAFYSSPAGRDFAAAQPKLAQAQMAGIGQWMGSIAPEIQSKLAQAVQKHGWGASK